MKYISYKLINGETINLRLDCEAAESAERQLGKGIPSIVASPDNFTDCMTVVAAAAGSKECAQRIYDDMLENGKNFEDFQMLMYEMLVAAGFMRGAALERLKTILGEANKKTDDLLQRSSEISSPQQSEQE